jgi:putative membrane protein
MNDIKYRQSVLKRARVTEEELVTVAMKVAELEQNTSGEIAVAITPESHDYSFWELLFAVLSGAVVFSCMLMFANYITPWLESLFWGEAPSWIVPFFYGVIIFFVIAFLFLAANMPWLDRIVIPLKNRRYAVHLRAVRHFADSGVYATKEHSGILIFVSLLEREVQIIADSGICSKIDQSQWNQIATDLAQGFSAKEKGSSGKALLTAVSKCGDLLSTYFPPEKENPNELRDAVVILRAGE